MKIKNKNIKLEYKNRALYLWEASNERRFELKTQFDEDFFLFCLVISNNKDIDLTFEEFADWLEKNPKARLEFIEFLKRNDIKQEDFIVKEDNDSDDAKKKH